MKVWALSIEDTGGGGGTGLYGVFERKADAMRHARKLANHERELLEPGETLTIRTYGSGRSQHEAGHLGQTWTCANCFTGEWSIEVSPFVVVPASGVRLQGTGLKSVIDTTTHLTGP